MVGNILSGGVEEIHALKENLMELNGYKDNNEILITEELKLEKSIQSKEKVISEEIVNTTKKRKEEIDANFNELIDKTRLRIKKTRGKKEMSKNTKISDRIEYETSDLKEKHRQFQTEIKTILKQNQMPSFCNTKLFYSLFLPNGIGDFVIILIAAALILLALPCCIYFFVLPEENMGYLILIYFIIVLLFGISYMLIDNNVKDKNRKSINKIKVIRSNIIDNKKERNKIRKSILKDRDESSYGLDKFNQELLDLDNEINTTSEEKNDSLLIFENTTRFVIGEEIKVRYQEELTGLKQEYDRVHLEIKKTEDKIKTLSMKIASTYEVYLGKEFMYTDKLDMLENIMTINKLTTISEAVVLYKSGN